MDLFEYEGKILLGKYGITTPKGFLSSDDNLKLSYPFIAKAQVLIGGRGKAGGIKLIERQEDYIDTLESIMELNINGFDVQGIYLEEQVDFQKEYYLSIVMDRNKRRPVIIAGKNGGVNIEDAPKDQILTVLINPLMGLQSYMINKISKFLEVGKSQVEDLMKKLWELFINEKAELIEINPLFQDKSDKLIAGDAKITLEENENLKKHLILPRNQSSFERKCKGLHASGVQMDGETAIVASGAGLGMATLDIVSHQGLSINSLVDLQGHVIHDLESAKKLISYIKELKPKAFLFNFYFQLASCKVLADAISAELGDENQLIVVRMKGLDRDEAYKILERSPNIYVEEHLDEACKLLFEKGREYRCL